MDEKRIELKELKGNAIRCMIPFGDSEETKYIQVYNIIGDRRGEILSDLNELVNEDKDLTEYIINSYYTNLIMEFTDIKIDETDITEILMNPTLEFQILKHELDDMIYELQYEDLCKKISQSRLLILNGMKDQIDFEFGAYVKSLENQSNRINEILKEDVNNELQ